MNCKNFYRFSKKILQQKCCNFHFCIFGWQLIFSCLSHKNTLVHKFSCFLHNLSTSGFLHPHYKEKVEQGKGTADHLMPLGYLFLSLTLSFFLFLYFSPPFFFFSLPLPLSPSLYVSLCFFFLNYRVTSICLEFLVVQTV